jgi:thymidylate kinase
LKNKIKTEILHLVALLSYLDQKRIDYCIVGNVNGFLDEIYGDIDIVVQPAQISKLNKILYNFSKLRKIQIVQILQHEQVACSYIFSWIADNLKPRFLNLDVCSDYYWDGQLYISANDLLKDKTVRTYSGCIKMAIYVPNPQNGFIYYLIKKVLKLELTYEQTKYLWSQWDINPTACIKRASQFWTGEYVAIVINAMEKKNYHALYDAIPKLNDSLLKNQNISFYQFLREKKRLLKRILEPTGLSVALMGPDGSGKSNVAENIPKDLSPAFRDMHVYHLRPRLGFKNIRSSQSAKNPHSPIARGKLASFLKIIYYFLDYLFGYVMKIRPLISRSSIVVFDRYYHDILVDPKRFRYGASTWFVRMVGKAIPKPNIWILLDTTPEVIQTRKNEISFEETKRQCKAYRQLFKQFKNATVIDASAHPNHVMVEVNGAILDFLARRTEKRLVE